MAQKTKSISSEMLFCFLSFESPTWYLLAKSQVLLTTELGEVGSIKAFPLPVADEGNALMAQRSKAERVPLVGIPSASGTASVAPSNF